jgi:DNA-directed RNA polymerase subunit RPC12/RpoP
MAESLLVLLGTTVILAFLLAFLTPRLLTEKKNLEGEKVVVKSKCPICQCQLNIKRKEFRTLPALEMGMVVQQRPDMHNHPLSEYRCRQCSAALIFYMGDDQPQFVLSNVGENQKEGTQCTECHSRLLKPDWDRHTYTDNFLDAPLQSEHGLICSRCNAVCCLGCVKDATRNRTDDGSFLCPRCHRGPVEEIFYF